MKGWFSWFSWYSWFSGLDMVLDFLDFLAPPQWFWNLLPEKRSLAHSSSHRLLPKMYLLSFHRLATTFTSHCNCPHQHASYCSQWCSFKLPARFLNKPLQMFASTCILLQPVVFIQVPCSYFRSFGLLYGRGSWRHDLWWHGGCLRRPFLSGTPQSFCVSASAARKLESCEFPDDGSARDWPHPHDSFHWSHHRTQNGNPVSGSILVKAYAGLLHVLLCQSCFIESFVRLHLRSLWILPAPDHPVWQEVRDRSRTPPRTPPYPPPVTPPTDFGQMIPVTPSEAFGPRTPSELLVSPGTPESVWDTLLVKCFFL